LTETAPIVAALSRLDQPRTLGIVPARVLLVLLCAFAILLAASARNAQPLGGDEPHYLLIAESLFHDGDADVANDYRQRRAEFPGVLIDPHVSPAQLDHRPDGPWYSQHGVGLPVLLAVPVGLADHGGAILSMTAIGAIVLLLAVLWSRRFTDAAWPAWVAVALLGSAPSFLALQGRVFPDLLVAACLLASLLLLDVPRQRWWTVSLLAVIVAATPWIHFKNSLVFATIILLAVIRALREEHGRARAWHAAVLVAVPALSLACYELSVHAWYDSWSPASMYPPGNGLFAIDPASGIAASAFDTAGGLFTNNPALLLILVGAPFWFRAARGPFLRLVAIVGPTILLQSTFSDWSGGFSPHERYALQFVPAFTPAIALALERVRGAWRALVALLVGAQLLLTAAYLWLKPSWGRVNGVSPFYEAIERRLDLSLGGLVPAFDRHAGLLHGGAQLAFWTALALALVVVGSMLAARD